MAKRSSSIEMCYGVNQVLALSEVTQSSRYGYSIKRQVAPDMKHLPLNTAPTNFSFHLLFLLGTLLVFPAHAQSCEMIIYGNHAKAPKYWLEDGQAKGILVDVMNHLGEEMNCQFDVSLLPWKRSYLNATKGLGGIIGLSMSDERRKIFDYSDIMYIDELRLVVKKGNAFSFNGLTDLQGKLVGLGRGSHYGSKFDEALKAGVFKISEDDSPIDRFEKLLADRIDVLIVGPGKLGFDAVINSSQNLSQNLNQFVILPTPLKRDPNYLGLAQSLNKRDFLTKFNIALHEAKLDGTIKKILEKYATLDH